MSLTPASSTTCLGAEESNVASRDWRGSFWGMSLWWTGVRPCDELGWTVVCPCDELGYVLVMNWSSFPARQPAAVSKQNEPESGRICTAHLYQTLKMLFLLHFGLIPAELLFISTHRKCMFFGPASEVEGQVSLGSCCPFMVGVTPCQSPQLVTATCKTRLCHTLLVTAACKTRCTFRYVLIAMALPMLCVLCSDQNRGSWSQLCHRSLQRWQSERHLLSCTCEMFISFSQTLHTSTL